MSKGFLKNLILILLFISIASLISVLGANARKKVELKKNLELKSNLNNFKKANTAIADALKHTRNNIAKSKKAEITAKKKLSDETAKTQEFKQKLDNSKATHNQLLQKIEDELYRVHHIILIQGESKV